jgi:hypothetical protein
MEDKGFFRVKVCALGGLRESQLRFAADVAFAPLGTMQLKPDTVGALLFGRRERRVSR